MTEAFGRRLKRRRPPLCPEVELWLLGDDIDLEQGMANLREAEPPPFFAFCWGAGQVLARYVLDHPEIVRGRRVVDFGAGSGVVGIAAALAGAAEVVPVDPDTEARDAALANAELNGVTLRPALQVPDDWDLLLAADVLYEPETRDWLMAQARVGRQVLVADPERAGAPRLAGDPLLRLPARTFPDVDSPQKSAALFELLP